MRALRHPFLLAVSVAFAGCANPRVQANMAEAINEIGTEVSGIKQDLATIQFQVDSLKQIAAKQDTIIARLANLAGVPIPPR
jgi:hypothetical protein